MTAAELAAFLATFPPDTSLRASYDCGCAWGRILGVRKIVDGISGEVEVELEVE